MKIFDINKFLIVISLILVSMISAQTEAVESKVYSWQDQDKNGNSNKLLMFEGSTIDLDYLRVYSVVIKPGESFSNKKINKTDEALFIMKEGELEFQLKEDEKIIGPGSIVLLLPNEEFQAKNLGDVDAAYYLFEYTSKAPVDLTRGESEGGSFMVDWNDLAFHPHDRGGIREYFERATAMFRRFEMHVTTLNPGIKSHEPHTHTSDEMVLMINGNSTLQIGDSFFDASEGDLIFLGANKPHALSNVGSKSCMYFAFHGE